jgi:hypothetical protein
MLAFVLDHFLQYNYLPTTGPFYTGAAWPNVAVIAIVAPPSFLYTRAKILAFKRRTDEHRQWVAKHIAELHGNADPHPHFRKVA